MATPQEWQEEAARLRRDFLDPNESWVSQRLSDPSFRAGWNSALWEVHKLMRDGLTVDPETLMGMARA